MAALGWLWVAIVWALLLLGLAVGLASLLAPRRVMCPRCSPVRDQVRGQVPAHCELCDNTGWIEAKP